MPSLYIGNVDSPTLHTARQFAVPEAIDEVVIDHSGGLHEGVADGGADKAETAFLQGLAHGVRLGAGDGNLFERADGVDFGRAADELPDVAGEAAALFLHLEKSAGIADGRLDFQAIADDSGIGEKRLNFGAVVAGDLFWIEIVEGGTKSFALAKDDLPAQPGLRGVQNEKLEELAVVLKGHAPFAIVIRDGDGARGPGATNAAGAIGGFRFGGGHDRCTSTSAT